ncbi:MAG: hypothetical protein RR521_06850 [Clostridia bacterium]
MADCMIIRRGGGGGGGSAGVQVLAAASEAALPASAKEGTVGVITSAAIGKAYISPIDPTGTIAAGDLWLKTGTTSMVPIHIGEKNEILLYVTNGYQYNAGAWSTVDSYIYKAAAWVRLQYMIYDPTMISGWEKGFCTGGTFSMNAGAPMFIYADMGANNASAVTSALVDLTQYRTLRCSFTAAVTEKAITDCRLGVSTAKGHDLRGKPTKAQLTVKADGNYDMAYDVSTITGEYYVILNLTTTESYSKLSYSAVWLER